MTTSVQGVERCDLMKMFNAPADAFSACERQEGIADFPVAWTTQGRGESQISSFAGLGHYTRDLP
jgi:hypothetical protein